MKEAGKTLQSAVRRIYETRPYPSSEDKSLKDLRWEFPAMEWINAIWKPGRERTMPEKILVAGCGAGREAFAMSRKFPGAKIVAVDFSPRSISIARDFQRQHARMKNIRFVVADLSESGLSKKVGRNFDFACCHGVLTYIPEAENVLKNLAHCLKDSGALYLGVNGSQHLSVGLRQALPTFGIDISELQDGAPLRKILATSDALLGSSDSLRVARFSPELLASDLFGTFIQNLPMGDWMGMASRSGLHFQGSMGGWLRMRRSMEKGMAASLMPRSRAQVHELMEMLTPGAFHSLVFTKQPDMSVPWEDSEALLKWRPALTAVYRTALPRRGRSWQTMRKFKLESRATNTRLDWRMPEWELEILRKSNGKRTLGEIVERIDLAIAPDLLQSQLYVLYQLLVIGLLPPQLSVSTRS